MDQQYACVRLFVTGPGENLNLYDALPPRKIQSSWLNAGALAVRSRCTRRKFPVVRKSSGKRNSAIQLSIFPAATLSFDILMLGQFTYAANQPHHPDWNEECSRTDRLLSST